MNTPDWAKLAAVFPASEVEKKPQGKGVVLDYVGHAGITTRLNEVVGPDQWDWQPLATNDDGTPKFTDGGLWIKLTIWGVSKIGFGDPGTSTGTNGVKECIGDALRNAAMRFGIGTYLWSKSERAMLAKTGEAEQEALTPGQEAARFLEDQGLDPRQRLSVATATLGKSPVQATDDEWRKALATWQRDGIDLTPMVEDVHLPDRDQEPTPPPSAVMITVPQNRALHAALGKLGIKGDAVHEWLSQELNTPITSAKEVTAEEASFLIDKLKQAGAS